MERGWATFLLPYIEEGNIAKIYRTDKSFYAIENQPAITTPLAVFTCPSAQTKRGRSISRARKFFLAARLGTVTLRTIR